MTKARAVIFIPESAELPEGFQEMMESISPFVDTDVVRSYDRLNRELLPQASQQRPIVIVLAPTRIDLENLARVRELFENTRLILVLSDADAETVALGHGMQPRFIGYLAGGFNEITAVIQKMAGEPRLSDQYVGGKKDDHNQTTQYR